MTSGRSIRAPQAAPPSASLAGTFASDVRRILVVRLSAIGDVVMATCLLPALRQRYPEAHLAWLVEPAALDLLRHHPAIDEVLVWPKPQWQQMLRRGQILRLSRHAHRFIADLRARRFDWVLDLQGLLKSALLGYLSGAPRRVALSPREGGEIFATHAVTPDARDDGVGAEYRYLAGALGLDRSACRMSVVLGGGDGRSASQMLAGAGIQGRYAVFCPFTTRAQKHWLPQHWASVCETLWQTAGLPVVTLGAASHTGSAREIRPTQGRLFDLVGRTTIGQAAAVVQQANLVIGVDTGLTHLGVAQGVPTLALFGSTRPYVDPLAPHATVLYEPMPCAPCRRHPICDGTFPCMAALTPERVMAACRTLLAMPGHKREDPAS